MSDIRIQYCGHACFLLNFDGYRAVIDPYADGMVPGLPELKLEAEAVFCSHEHGDHAFVQAVALNDNPPAAPYTVETLETDHDDQGGVLRGKNRIHIFRFGNLTVAHLGDLGHIPCEAVLEKLKGVDCMLIPVGGFYTIDPDTAAKIVALTTPRVTVPMHYRTDSTGFDVLAHLTDFTNRYERVETCENTYSLTGEETNKILVILYNA